MRRLGLGTLALILTVGSAGAVAAGERPSGADHRLAISADARETGYVGLRLHGAAGLAVTIDESVEGDAPERIRELTMAEADVRLRRAAEWRCDRRTRTFVVSAADGRNATASVRTPTCEHRLAIAAPRRVHEGEAVRYRVFDRWRLGGLRARVCVEPPGGPARCRQRAVGERGLRARFTALRPGGWLVRAAIEGGSARRVVRARGDLTVLATGDSMIQIIDSYLKQRLRPRGVRVRSDAHISTGISKPSLLDWQTQARRQAARRPDVVVMFLGANDGFPMGDAGCCGEAWVAEYARRARRMMATYARGGRARVYWLLLPAPRSGFFRETFPAVNAGIRRAAARARRDVRVIDLVRVFTPGGRYRASMPIGGRMVRVRQSDGVHLNTTGASLAASIVIRTLRRERILR